MLPLLLLGCSSSSSDFVLDEATWDPAVVPAKDGVYVNLPAADQLVRVASDGTVAQVDLTGASVDRMTLAPDQETILVSASWPVCADPDPHVKLVSDCN